MSRQGQPQEPTVSNIKEFWEREAQEIGRTPQVTIRDHYFRVHELHTLVALVPTSESLLDVGCGTGLGTLALARKAKSSVGISSIGYFTSHFRRVRMTALKLTSPGANQQWNQFQWQVSALKIRLKLVREFEKSVLIH
jgi:cyclopropane fatty-acyl-phospholipid synthase-like methyltransferase